MVSLVPTTSHGVFAPFPYRTRWMTAAALTCPLGGLNPTVTRALVPLAAWTGARAMPRKPRYPWVKDSAVRRASGCQGWWPPAA